MDTDMGDAIPLYASGSPKSSGATYAASSSPQPVRPAAQPEESDLLKTIRAILRPSSSSPSYPPRQGRILSHSLSQHEGEDELFWTSRTVIWSSGGVQKRKWIFENESQDVQCACFAWFDSSKTSTGGQSRQTLEKRPTSSVNFLSSGSTSSTRATFGPFAQLRRTEPRVEEKDKNRAKLNTRAICIFLWDIAKIYTREGLEYTINVPFPVGRAWEILPVGIMLQSVITNVEYEDPSLLGQEPMPNLYTLSGPFDEVKMVGFASKIEGGFESAAIGRIPEGPAPTVTRSKLISRLGKLERVLFVSPCNRPRWTTPHRVIVSHDPERRKLTVWRYVYIRVDDLPKPLSKAATSGPRRQPPRPKPYDPRSPAFSAHFAGASPVFQSDKGPRPRTFPVLGNPPTLPKLAPLTTLPTLPALSALPSLPSFGSSNTNPTPLLPSHTIRPGPSASSSTISTDPRAKSRIPSQSRNELSITLDRLALGGTGEGEGPVPFPVMGMESLPGGEFSMNMGVGADREGGGMWELPEEGRMQPEVWMEKLHQYDLVDADCAAYEQISVSVFDERCEHSILAISFGASQTLHLLRLSLPQSASSSKKSQHSRAKSSTPAVPTSESNRATKSRSKGATAYAQDKDPAVFPEAKTGTTSTSGAEEDTRLRAEHLRTMRALSASSVICTRDGILDLMIVKHDHSLAVLTHELHELRITLGGLKSGHGAEGEAEKEPSNSSIEIRDIEASDLVNDTNWYGTPPRNDEFRIARVEDVVDSGVTIVSDEGRKLRLATDLVPRNNSLIIACLRVLSLALPANEAFEVKKAFLRRWAGGMRKCADRDTEFDCFKEAILGVLVGGGNGSGVDAGEGNSTAEQTADEGDMDVEDENSAWNLLASSLSHRQMLDDPALRNLVLPAAPSQPRPTVPGIPQSSRYLLPALYALHLLGEQLKIDLAHQHDLVRLAPLLVTLSRMYRQDWADYWMRVCPDSSGANGWNTCPPSQDNSCNNQPPDLTAYLYSRIARPETVSPSFPTLIPYIASKFRIVPSMEYGRIDPLSLTRHIVEIYSTLCAAPVTPETYRIRAHRTVQKIIQCGMSSASLNKLPLGVIAPLREAIRTCQAQPPGDWSAAAYNLIERNDLAQLVGGASSNFAFGDAYRQKKEYYAQTDRDTINGIAQHAKNLASETAPKEMDTDLISREFTDVRYGEDQRLREVERLLSSSRTPIIKYIEQPGLDEHEQAKEQSNLLPMIAERTLSLPLGRAIYTFGSVPTVSADSYAIPKIELSIKIVPQNMTLPCTLDVFPPETRAWVEFHNGVAAALRISPSSDGVDSSWIAFNKPSELNAEHAGFLFGLGLSGHLRSMVTWHAFGYLTPKHDLTSVGVLLGLSAAYMGTGDNLVTKLLSVHTPALLPPKSAELNIPLATQCAGLMGVGVLYLGTRHRRMAEVSLNEISRRDLGQADVTNEQREAYAITSALAFGMIMCGYGVYATSPADLAILERLRILVHGDPPPVAPRKPTRPSFDVNLTSPAATIALGLMYMRSERADIAALLEIPDTPVALSRVQPSFLLLRTLSRGLIMWDSITPSIAWIASQMPQIMLSQVERSQGSSLEDTFELGYYYVIAGACFAMALKYAGTANEEAYNALIHYFDELTQITGGSALSFNSQIKRSAIREALNLVCVCLGVVMAGTGEVQVLRRLRLAHGTYGGLHRYGTHVAIHMALGLLFLGGGRYTLGNSDAAIACLVVSLYPRFPTSSAETKGLLQAFRHMWVLAVEPRCLIARDADTGQAVYIPVKCKIGEGDSVRTHKYICPTLIPDFNRLISIKVDNQRYWPFYLNIAGNARHREVLLRTQTIYVKRRTGWLDYGEDPKANRSINVRNGGPVGDPTVLDFPTAADGKQSLNAELHEFITSFAHDSRVTAFADRFCRNRAETADEKRLYAFCQQSLLECLAVDKPQTLQSYLTIHYTRLLDPTSSPLATLAVRDLLFAAEFYNLYYLNSYGGCVDRAFRPPLIRPQLLQGALHAIDDRLAEYRSDPAFLAVLDQYLRGEDVSAGTEMPSQEPAEPASYNKRKRLSRQLVIYLARESVPSPPILSGLRKLSDEMRVEATQALGLATMRKADLPKNLDDVLRIPILMNGNSVVGSYVQLPWTLRSVEDVLRAWRPS